MLEKHVIGYFSSFFERALTFLAQNLPSAVLRQDKLKVEKVFAPSKTISKSPIMCFARIKNNLPHD
jgi:hypothetical protein